MADLFRRRLDIDGPGGVKCFCCNRFRKNKKQRRLLRKMARVWLKRALYDEIVNNV